MSSVLGPPARPREEAIETLYRQFSCPQENGRGVLPEIVACLHARETVRILTDVHADPIDARSDGLLEFLRGWADSDVEVESAWDPLFGEAFRLARGGEGAEVATVAARLALHLAAEEGRPCSWRAEVDPGQGVFRWGDHLLPATHIIEVEASSTTATLTFPGAEASSSQLHLVRDGHRWRQDHSSSSVSLARIGPFRVLTREWVPEDFLAPDVMASQCENLTPEMVSSLEGALSLLAEHAAPYLGWVERFVRDLLVLQGEPGKLRSGSSSDLSGLVYLALPQEPAAVAEMLVHEGSHQYFHLISRIEPVVDGSDSSLYFSPAVGRPRPLDRILVAYHAFANVSLLYSMCLASGLSDKAYCRQKQAELIPQLEQLERPLISNPSLTAAGRGLFEPLSERLRELSSA